MKLAKHSWLKITTLAMLLLLAAVFIGCNAAAPPDQGATSNSAPTPAAVSEPRSQAGGYLETG